MLHTEKKMNKSTAAAMLFLFADPDPVTGHMESAIAVELNPWVEYEFRVVANNAIGTGDPSAPSRAIRTKEAGKSSLASDNMQVSF